MVRIPKPRRYLLTLGMDMQIDSGINRQLSRSQANFHSPSSNINVSIALRTCSSKRTGLSFPPDLIAPKDTVAQELHRESDAGKDRPKQIYITLRNLEEMCLNLTKKNLAV